MAGGVLRLTLNRPAKRNAITADMYLALADAIEGAGEDAEVRVVVIDAVGAHFSAGNDVAEFLGGQYSLSSGSPWRRFAECLPALNRPLIAGVQGHAVGIGLTMLLHADIVILDTTARLSAPFAQLGLVPEAASSGLLPLRIGRAKANEIFLLGRALDASEAERLGLASRVVEAGKASEEALRIAIQIAALPSVSVAHIKRLGTFPYDSDRDRIAAECDAFMECVTSEGTRVILSELGKRRRA